MSEKLKKAERVTESYEEDNRKKRRERGFFGRGKRGGDNEADKTRRREQDNKRKTEK